MRPRVSATPVPKGPFGLNPFSLCVLSFFFLPERGSRTPAVTHGSVRVRARQLERCALSLHPGRTTASSCARAAPERPQRSHASAPRCLPAGKTCLGRRGLQTREVCV